MVGKVPGISLRTSGPGQTEYEMRGLSAGGGAAATVGFYLDETPLSASAVALNGRTVIDADLFDLNNVEVLRGPQGTLYGAGSMGGTIKLVTNQPKLGAFEAATDSDRIQIPSMGQHERQRQPDAEHTAGRYRGFAHGHAAKYISGWIDRNVSLRPVIFRRPTNPGGTPTAPPLCGAILLHCVAMSRTHPSQKVVRGANLERYRIGAGDLSGEALRCATVTTTLMYQRINADGYNDYQQQPGGDWRFTSPMTSRSRTMTPSDWRA